MPTFDEIQSFLFRDSEIALFDDAISCKCKNREKGKIIFYQTLNSLKDPYAEEYLKNFKRYSLVALNTLGGK